MKKFFAIAVIATAFVACNNDAETKETTKDTTVEIPVTPVNPDTTNTMMDTTITVIKDTTTKM